jgi:hypothetical protein
MRFAPQISLQDNDTKPKRIMAATIPPVWGPGLFYILASILNGSTFITYTLKHIKLDLKFFLSSRAGHAITASFSDIHELFLRTPALSDPLSPPKVTSFGLTSRGCIETLPQRAGPRPVVEGISKHRQVTQLPSLEETIHTCLRDLVADFTVRYPQQTYLGRSTFEDQGITLFARHRVYNDTKYYGEILCAHSSDSFMHLTLNPTDAKMVIEKGWGQQHPLASRRASWFYWGGNQPAPVPGCLMLIYAPKGEAELQIIEQIISAGVWLFSSVDARVDDESRC